MAGREKAGMLAWAQFWVTFVGVIVGVPMVIFQLDEANQVQWQNALYDHTNALTDIERNDPVARCLYPYLGVNSRGDCASRVFQSQETVTHALAYTEQAFGVLEDIADYQDAYCSNSFLFWRQMLWCEDERDLHSYWIGEIHADPTGLFRFSISSSSDDIATFVGAPCSGTRCSGKLAIFSQRELEQGVAQVRARLASGLPATEAETPQRPIH